MTLPLDLTGRSITAADGSTGQFYLSPPGDRRAFAVPLVPVKARRKNGGMPAAAKKDGKICYTEARSGQEIP